MQRQVINFWNGSEYLLRLGMIFTIFQMIIDRESSLYLVTEKK